MGNKMTDYVHPNYMIFAIFLGFFGILLMFSGFAVAKMFGLLLLILVLIVLIIISKDIKNEKLALRKK